MLLVGTEVKPSRIHGNGLFVTEFVPKGAKVWEFTPSIDRVFAVDYVREASEQERTFILTYAYFCKRAGGYVFCGDNARFVNHSEEATIHSGGDGLTCIALCDLHPGDEIVEDYRTYDEDPLAQWNALFQEAPANIESAV